jgi:hypothetical protein
MSVIECLGYGLDDFRQKQRYVPLPYSVQTGFGMRPTRCSLATGRPSSRLNRLKREGDHFPPFSFEVKRAWGSASPSCTS